MDAAAFDHLSRALSVPGTRRRLLGLVTTLPLVGGALSWLDAEEGDAKERRRRRKGRHKDRRGKAQGKRDRQRNKRACKPQGKAKTCAGRCGLITNRQTCGKTVDCGSCDCPTPCATCLICQSGPNTPGACGPDPEQVGEPCGSEGQVCQAAGICACGAGTCANPAPICAGGTCVACAGDGDCVAANLGGLCCAGSCYEGVCCADGDCLAEGAPDCVENECVCAGNGNAACSGNDACCPAGCFDLDNDPGHCGDCATACAATEPFCVAGECEPCSATRLCPAGQFCQTDGSCVASCTVCQTSSGGLCMDIANLNHNCATPCPSGQWCDAGACASIQDTVTLPDCHSMCGGPTEVCGQMVTCPGCDKCIAQTGCSSNELQNGPLGPGYYCSFADRMPCTTNDQCSAPHSYCNTGTGSDRCAQICPFSS